VLTIIAGYVNKNDQIASPYFPVVINCLSDSSPVVVKSALCAVRDLAKTATDEELAH
jgi:hypothetical protein